MNLEEIRAELNNLTKEELELIQELVKELIQGKK